MARNPYRNRVSAPPPPDQSQPQTRDNEHGPGYRNDTKGWLRGGGGDGRGPQFRATDTSRDPATAGKGARKQ